MADESASTEVPELESESFAEEITTDSDERYPQIEGLSDNITLSYTQIGSDDPIIGLVIADICQIFMQKDLDITINEIRKRASVNMPAVTLSGKNFSVNGVIINDPDRDLGNSEVFGDYEVSPILWEVRRERRIELVYEGIRFDDIRRWGKLHYADMKINKKLNLGAGWIRKLI